MNGENKEKSGKVEYNYDFFHKLAHDFLMKGINLFKEENYEDCLENFKKVNKILNALREKYGNDPFYKQQIDKFFETLLGYLDLTQKKLAKKNTAAAQNGKHSFGQALQNNGFIAAKENIDNYIRSTVDPNNFKRNAPGLEKVSLDSKPNSFTRVATTRENSQTINTLKNKFESNGDAQMPQKELARTQLNTHASKEKAISPYGGKDLNKGNGKSLSPPMKDTQAQEHPSNRQATQVKMNNSNVVVQMNNSSVVQTNSKNATTPPNQGLAINNQPSKSIVNHQPINQNAQTKQLTQVNRTNPDNTSTKQLNQVIPQKTQQKAVASAQPSENTVLNRSYSEQDVQIMRSNDKYNTEYSKNIFGTNLIDPAKPKVSDNQQSFANEIASQAYNNKELNLGNFYSSCNDSSPSYNINKDFTPISFNTFCKPGGNANLPIDKKPTLTSNFVPAQVTENKNIVLCSLYQEEENGVSQVKNFETQDYSTNKEVVVGINSVNSVSPTKQSNLENRKTSVENEISPVKNIKTSQFNNQKPDITGNYTNNNTNQQSSKVNAIPLSNIGGGINFQQFNPFSTSSNQPNISINKSPNSKDQKINNTTVTTVNIEENRYLGNISSTKTNSIISKYGYQPSKIEIEAAELINQIREKSFKVPDQKTISDRSKSKDNTSNGGKKTEKKSVIDEALKSKILDEIVESSPNVKFSDLAGLSKAKQMFKEIIILPSLRPDLFTGLRAPARGVLLFGPPGTGKTMLAKAVASECNSTFFNISASSLTSKWVGESEKLVRALFELAYEKAPSIIFIDEIESILSKRKEDGNEASSRLKTEFLIQFDGVGSNLDARVLIVGATNRPFDLDPAVIRRLPKRIYLPPFESEERKLFLKKVMGSVENTLKDSDYSEIAKLTDLYSNSDLKELCREAAYEPVREISDISTLSSINKLRPINHNDFIKAVKTVRPSLSQDMLKELETWNKDFGAVGK